MIGLPDEATDAELAEHLESARTTLDPDRAGATCRMVRRGRVGADHARRAIRAGAPDDRTAARRHRRDRPAGACSAPLALGDARRTAPERLRMILRQAVDRARLGSGRSGA